MDPGEAPGRRFLTADWRWLVMLNYAVDPAVLRPYLPAGTELDAWDGRACASVVGFRFLRARLLGIPVPGHGAFEEVNLRFYVRRRAPEGWRRGVVFVREIVPRRAVAAVGRLYGENFAALPMRHRVELDPAAGGEVEYGWKHGGRWCTLAARVEGPARPLEPGSEAEFIAEHYWAYTAGRRGTVEYRVEHAPWNAWLARDAVLDGDVAALYGERFADSLSALPRSALVADGSPVSVFTGTRLPAYAAAGRARPAGLAPAGAP
ncbi:MAG TPA: DUF2071 domain-containing protein [Longimicrobium sp.]|nr:DUF2071 domain-containing protein [Longimicrobium sp.]